MNKPKLVIQDYIDAAKKVPCSVAAIKAVAIVESGSRGGFNPDGSPVTLFEGHKFHEATNGIYDTVAPDLSFPAWDKSFYGKTWQQEQRRLQRAMVLDRDAALRSASWGKFQIMGFNHVIAGHTTLQKFVNAMYRGEREHLNAFVAFVLSKRLGPALRRLDWEMFASVFNGRGYKANQWDTKIAAAYQELVALA